MYEQKFTQFDWKYPSKYQTPPDDLNVLCFGTGPDSEVTHGYFIARFKPHWDPPTWIMGRHQQNCRVEKWCIIQPNIFFGKDIEDSEDGREKNTWEKVDR